jgi:chromosome segregation ATPase
MVRRSSPGTKPPTAKEAAHAAGVRVEQMQSDIKGILEAVTGLGQELRAEMQALGTKLSGKIEDLEDVVRTNSADIRTNSADIRTNSADIRTNSADIRQNTADIKALRVELTGFRHDFDHREERGRVSALEDRVSAIETQLSTASR